MLKDKKAVIFDLDGTLVDSMGIWTGIDIEYLGRHGLSVPGDLQPAIEGFSFTEVAVYFKDRFGLTDSIEQIKDDWNRMAMDKYRCEVPLKPGAARFIGELKRRGLHPRRGFQQQCGACQRRSGRTRYSAQLFLRADML